MRYVNGEPSRIVAAFYGPRPVNSLGPGHGIIIRAWGEIVTECIHDYGPYVSEMPDLPFPPLDAHGVWLWEGEAGGGEYNPQCGDADDIWWQGKWRKLRPLELVKVLDEPAAVPTEGQP